MFGTDKVKKREPLYLSKIDKRVSDKLKKEAASRGLAPWLFIEFLLSEAMGINTKATSKLFKKD